MKKMDMTGMHVAMQRLALDADLIAKLAAKIKDGWFQWTQDHSRFEHNAARRMVKHRAEAMKAALDTLLASIPQVPTTLPDDGWEERFEAQWEADTMAVDTATRVTCPGCGLTYDIPPDAIFSVPVVLCGACASQVPIPEKHIKKDTP